MHVPIFPTVRNSSLITSKAGARRLQLGCSKLGHPAFAPWHAGPPGCLHFQSPGVRAATHLHAGHLPGLTWSQSRPSVLHSWPSDSYSSQLPEEPLASPTPNPKALLGAFRESVEPQEKHPVQEASREGPPWCCMATTPCPQCRRPEFNPWSGKLDPTTKTWHSQTNTIYYFFYI